MKFLFLIGIVVFSSNAYSQFFSSSGTFLNDVESLDDVRIGWKTLEYNEVYSGVVSLAGKTEKENLFCSGALVTSKPIKENNPVYLVTNGHCSTIEEEFFSQPTLVARNRKIQTLYAFFNNFSNSQESTFFVSLGELMYSRIYQKDIAIINTKKTVKDFYDMNIRVYTFADTLSKEVVSVGTPLENMDLKKLYLHISNCKIGESVRLSEGEFQFSALRNNCSLVGGQSGSPILNSSNEIIALQNTGYEDVSEISDCDIGKPCEILKDNSRTPVKEWSYAQSTIGLNFCFNSQTGQFNEEEDSCPLKGL